MQNETGPLVVDGLRRLSHRWWLLLAFGVLLVLAGIAAAGATVVATLATVIFLGAVLLAGGVVDIASALATRHWRGFGLSLVGGILMAILGIMLMARPAVGAGVLTLLLALVLLGSGIGRIVFSLVERFPSWGWSALSGVVAVVLGALVLSGFPSSAFWFLGLVIAVELLFRGTTWIALSFALRRAGSRLETPARPEHTVPSQVPVGA